MTTATGRRRAFGFVDWRLRPDQKPDAPPTTYAFRCLTRTGDGAECRAASPRSEDPHEPQTWAFQHQREHPEHTGYAEEIERPWTMWRGGPA